jgi:N-glycosidase YbiA
MPILFYSHTVGPYVAFSNFSPHPFELDDAVWPTVEHYFQAAKFPGSEHAEAIRLARSPREAKRLGRSRAHPIRSDWDDTRDDVMRRAVRQKFETHADLRALLLATGDEELVEDAPRDYYWGRGARGTGKNRLGVILMEVRAGLRADG